MPERQTFRLRPPLRALPWIVLLVGLAFGAAALGGQARGPGRTFALVCAVVGPLLAAAYLFSPAWRLVVEVDDDALTVRRGDDVRFRLPWSEVVRVVASPATKSCFVDGGSPARSLLVPGPGTPRPYRIEGSDALYEAILARAPRERVEKVDRLRGARAASSPRA